MEIRIKDGVSVIYNKDSKYYTFFVSTTDVEKVYELQPEYQLFIELLKEHSNVDVIYSLIKEEYPNFSKIEFLESIEILKYDGILSYNYPLPEAISKKESIRFKRQIDFFSDLNPRIGNPWEYQLSLKKSTVLILGIGGLGSWIAMYLSMSGIGKIIICDFDIVEEHNLSRQALYTSEDIGNLKIEALKNRIKLINEKVNIQTMNIRLSQDNLHTLERVIASSDIVINCTDYPDINTTSTWISKLCMTLGKPHIIGGGYSGHTGIIGPTIIPKQTICWDCMNSTHDEFVAKSNQNVIINMRKSAGASVILSSFVANIQSWECIKILTKISRPIVTNRRGFLDVNTLSIEWVESKVREDCDFCKDLLHVSEEVKEK